MQSKGDKEPEGPNWLHEIKWDGYRVGAYLQDGKVRVLARNLHDWTKEFPTIVQGVSQLKATNAMIDGEAFVADVGGMSHFSLLQRARPRRRPKPDHVRRIRSDHAGW
ncbi:hypothetical protein [Neomesorhizobium albiziae]|uniref:ATP-dependent DNA ligase n=1 Tax=Neomesorhizobium albiziae TaxID=335020 RepID=UPI003CC7C68C